MPRRTNSRRYMRRIVLAFIGAYWSFGGQAEFVGERKAHWQGLFVAAPRRIAPQTLTPRHRLISTPTRCRSGAIFTDAPVGCVMGTIRGRCEEVQVEARTTTIIWGGVGELGVNDTSRRSFRLLHCSQFV